MSKRNKAKKGEEELSDLLARLIPKSWDLSRLKPEQREGLVERIREVLEDNSHYIIGPLRPSPLPTELDEKAKGELEKRIVGFVYHSHVEHKTYGRMNHTADTANVRQFVFEYLKENEAAIIRGYLQKYLEEARNDAFNQERLPTSVEIRDHYQSLLSRDVRYISYEEFQRISYRHYAESMTPFSKYANSILRSLIQRGIFKRPKHTKGYVSVKS